MNHAGRLVLLLALAAAWGARADEPPVPPADTARITDDALRGAGGRVAVNQAAGIGNTQANLAAIAANGAPSISAVQQPPEATALDAVRGRAAGARVDAHAFAGGSGLLAVNQAAGSGNAQLNLFAVGAGAPADVRLSALDDAALAAVAAPPSTGTTPPPPSAPRTAVIADGAFRGDRGVLQVNQTAGVGNASTNAIVLSLGSTP